MNVKTADVSKLATVVTPDMARIMLASNADNQRSLSQRSVDTYARDMAAGRWELNGEAIVFDEHGRLSNGQHRLRAVIKANVPVRMLVLGNAPASAIHTYDRGRVRTPEQVFKMLGRSNGKDVTSIANAVFIICGLPDLNADRYHAKLSVAELDRVCVAHPGIAWIVEKSSTCATNVSRLNIAPVRAGFAIAYEKHPVPIDAAWESFATGANLSVGDPLLTLRSFLANGGGSVGGQWVRSAITRRTLTALCYKVRGESLMKSCDGDVGVEFFGISPTNGDLSDIA